MDPILYATADNPVPENHLAGFFEGRGGVEDGVHRRVSNGRQAFDE